MLESLKSRSAPGAATGMPLAPHERRRIDGPPCPAPRVMLAALLCLWFAGCEAGSSEVRAAPVEQFSSGELSEYGTVYDVPVPQWRLPPVGRNPEEAPMLAKMVEGGHLIASQHELVRFAELAGSAASVQQGAIEFSPALTMWIVSGNEAVAMQLEAVREQGHFTYDFPFDGAERVPKRFLTAPDLKADSGVVILHTRKQAAASPAVDVSETVEDQGSSTATYRTITVDLDADAQVDVTEFQLHTKYVECPEEDSCAPQHMRQIAVRSGSAWHVTAYRAEGMDGPAGH